MKIWVLAFILLITVFTYAEEAVFDMKAPFEKGTIYYEMTGNTKGSEILYIKDWGKTMARYKSTVTKVLMMTKKEKIIEINTPEWDYDFDMIEKTGTKQRSMIFFMRKEYENLSKADKKKFNKNAMEMGLSTVRMFNGEVVENAEKILGFSCDKATMMGTEAYTIHNTSIVLKTVSNILGMKMAVTAVKLDKGKVDEAKFELPKGIEPIYDEQADAMIEQAAKREIEMILSGEFKPVEIEDSQAPKSEKNNDEQPKDFKDAMKKLNNLFGN